MTNKIVGDGHKAGRTIETPEEDQDDAERKEYVLDRHVRIQAKDGSWMRRQSKGYEGM